MTQLTNIKDELDSKNQTLLTKEDLFRNESGLIKKIDEAKIEIIRWMFVFWITILLMIIGLYIKN